MKISDYIVEFLREREVKVVFGYIGGMITHFVDSLARSEGIDFIQVYHEQTASIAAEGYSKSSGNIGVAISTSGPGATNMITGIADAYFDSIPVIYITGQVNTNEYKYDKPIRQQGFQETNIVEIVKPITKYAVLVDKVDLIKYELEKAYSIAKSGRPGPVLLDIPMNIQREDVDVNGLLSYTADADRSTNIIDYNYIIDLIRKSERPMVLAGSGVINSGAISLLERFAEKFNLPVVCSLLGKGAFNEESSKFIGMIGSYGNRCANIAVANVDLLIAIGTRLDTRQTGAMYDKFVSKGSIIHVDIDSNELEYHRIENRLKIKDDASNFISNLLRYDITRNEELHNNWFSYLSNLKEKYNQKAEIDRFVENKIPYKIFEIFNTFSKEGDVFTVDIGQNQMWAAQSLILKENQKFVTSGGLAPMGFSIPAAIGFAFENPHRKIYSINGDGGFHISTQSLMLISQYNLPIKVFVLNNSSLGMITQFQELYFNNLKAATVEKGGYLVPGIKHIAAAYSIPYFRLTEYDLNDSDLIEEIMALRNCIVEYVIDGVTKVSPKLEYNKSIENPSPELPNDELLGNMLI